MPAATWSRRAATRTWKNSSRLVAKIAQNLARSSSGMPGSPASSRTLSLKSSQLSSRLSTRWVMTSGSPVGASASSVIDAARSRLGVFGQPEVPLERDQLALGVAVDALLVAPELRIVAGQEHQAGERPCPELVEHLPRPRRVLLPRDEPQFRRNKERINRDAERELI